MLKMIHRELKQEILSKKHKKKHYPPQMQLNHKKREDVVESKIFNDIIDLFDLFIFFIY
jgi:hypothetical protein